MVCMAVLFVLKYSKCVSTGNPSVKEKYTNLFIKINATLYT